MRFYHTKKIKTSFYLLWQRLRFVLPFIQNFANLNAAKSIGLSPGQILNLVILPQALRVIIPPLTSQMLNLTKNSSLAVAIGFPDFVSVASTTINQTGQAIEGVTLIMVVYLCFSLLTSFFMNWYNKRMALVER